MQDSSPLSTPAQQPVDRSQSLTDNGSSQPLAQNHILHTFDTAIKPTTSMTKSHLRFTAILSLVAIIAGVSTGYGAYRLQGKAVTLTGTSETAPMQQVAGDSVKAGDVFGIQDQATFKDSAEGYLEKGGIDGEGSHKLLRPGGDSQTVYLTSSVTDLDKFEGMQVKISGETFKAQTAGWLMDVGRVEVINPQATAPTE